MQIAEIKTGAPCWFALSSTDPIMRKQFYHQLFGRQSTDLDLRPIGVYSFLSNSNGTVGACCGLPPDQQAKCDPVR